MTRLQRLQSGPEPAYLLLRIHTFSFGRETMQDYLTTLLKTAEHHQGVVRSLIAAARSQAVVA